MASPNMMQKMIRNNVSPKLTSFYAKLGFANRNSLAGNLHQLQVPTGNHADVVAYLKDKGVLKGRFGPASLNEIQPYMLKKLVTTADARVLFKGSEEALNNISGGLQAGWDTITLGTYDHESKIAPAFNIAILLGTVAAAGYGATLIGLPAMTGFGACSVYGMISEVLASRIKNPNSNISKIIDFGRRLFPIALGATIIDGAYMSSVAREGMFVDAVSKLIGAKGLLYCVGGTLGLAAIISAIEIKLANSKHMSAFKRLKEGTIRGNILLANGKIWSGFNYLGYRLLTYLAYGVGAATFHLGTSTTFPWLLAGSFVLGIAWRLGTSRMHVERKTEKLSKKVRDINNYVNAKIFHRAHSRVVKYKNYRIRITGVRTVDDEVNLRISLFQKKKAPGETGYRRLDRKTLKAAHYDKMAKNVEEYIENYIENKGAYIEAGKCIAEIKKDVEKIFYRAKPKEHPIAKVGIEYVSGVAIRYFPFMLPLLFVADPLQLTFDLATLYFGARTIFADVLSQHAAILSAFNLKRSTFNTEVPYISDADKGKVNALCTRLCAYVNEDERSIIKLINMLIMEYPQTSVLLCSDRDPYADIKVVKAMRTGREVLGKMEELRGELFREFNSGYTKLKQANSGSDRAEIKARALELADILTRVGNLYYPGKDDPNSYVEKIKTYVAEDKARKAQGLDARFNLAGEEPYLRKAYRAIEMRGYEFLEMARQFKEMANENKVSYERIEKFYKDMLGNFSVDVWHVVRKAEYGDERTPTKTFNLGATESHLGDSLYEVWRIEKSEEKSILKHESIPATYIRVRNPEYNYLEGDCRENYRYVWLRREDFLSVIGLSQATSNDIQYADNTPEGIKAREEKFGDFTLKIAGEKIPVHGFYSNEDMLPVKKLIDWHGREVTKNEYTWVAGESASPRFIDAFKEWGRALYGKKEYEEFLKKSGGLWFKDKPEMLSLTPSENYDILDEGYIVLDTERQLGAELDHTAKIYKNLNVVNYEEREATFDSPDPDRPIEKVRSWRVEDAELGIRYTVGGKEFSLPYTENRRTFIRYDRSKQIESSAWKRISYGLIKYDSNGRPYIEVYSRKNERLGIVAEVAYPIHMHPADMIKKDDTTGLPRIEFDVFKERLGRGTWLVADYGDNYIDEKRKEEHPEDEQLYNRYRTVCLDFDDQAKQEFWPNFIASVKALSDGKKIQFTTIAPNCATVPVERKLLGIKMAADAQVLGVDFSGSGYIDPKNHTWSPKMDNLHTEKVTGGIMLVRNSDGSQKIVQISKLPSGLNDPRDARRVVNVEKGKDEKGKEILIFNKLRFSTGLILDKLGVGNRLKSDPGFVYSLPQHLFNSFNSMDNKVVKPGYRQLRYLLEKDDITVKIGTENGKHVAKLYDDKGNPIDIVLDLSDLVDNEGKSFLQNAKYGMNSLESFYQRSDGNYSGTEEYRPRLVRIGGVKNPQIKLILTRVEKIKVSKTAENQNVFNLISEMRDPLMFFAVPTSAVKVAVEGREKWVPMSLTEKIDYKETPNMARIEVKVNEGGKTAYKYLNTTISKNLPKGALFIKKDKGSEQFCAYTIKLRRNEMNYLEKEEVNLGSVAPEVAAKIREDLKANNIQEAEEIIVEVFHTRNPEVIDGEYQSVVHGQRQHGGYYLDEMFPAVDAAQLRDELFYGVSNEIFSEAFPPNGDPYSHGIQRGKTLDYDKNDNYVGKPIENGTPFMDRHKHLFELVEVALGFPKGTMIALAPVIDRCGGYEKVMHKHGAKLILYCREKGWLNGVSEDEQGALALALALGYKMKYFLKVTTFESQPNKWGAVKQQDFARYNTAMALAKDVLIPWEVRQFKNWLAGKHVGGTTKRILEHLAFRYWYEWPKAKMAREFSPGIYLASAGHIKPYIIDPYFMAAYLMDFGLDVWMNTRIRRSLGRTKDMTGHRPLWWTLVQQPAINQSFLFGALQGGGDLFRQGWQYGPFQITAEYKESRIPPENKVFLKMLMSMQVVTSLIGLYGTVPGSALAGLTTDLGYYINEFWALYSAAINYKGLKYIKECENGNPASELKKYKGPGADLAEICLLIDASGSENINKAKEKLNAYISDYVKKNKTANTQLDYALTCLTVGKLEIAKKELLAYQGAIAQIGYVYGLVNSNRIGEARKQLKSLEGVMQKEIVGYIKEHKGVVEFIIRREKATKEIDNAYKVYGELFKKAYDLACTKDPGNIRQAKVILNKMIVENNKYKDPDMVILAKALLNSLGVG